MSVFQTANLKNHIQATLRPVDPMPLVEWVEKKRMLSSTSSSEPGKFDLNRTPYQRGILEAFDDPKQEEISVMKSAQCGISECCLNLFGHAIAEKPKTLMYLLPNWDMARKFSSQRLEELIEGHSFIKSKIRNNFKKTDNKLVKVYPGGLLAITCSNSSASIRSLPVGVAVLDEIDLYQAFENEGHVLDIVRGRFLAQPQKKIICLSTPTVEGSSIIYDLWLNSDQRRFFVPCPSCNEFNYFKFEDFTWQGDDHTTTKWRCPACQVEVEESKKQKMMIGGKWISTIPESERKGKSTGFHVSSWYSPLGWSASSWSEIVKQFLAIKGSEEKYKTWTNIYQGMPWSPTRAKTPEAEIIFNRREDYKRNIVKKDYIALTCGVDVQGDRIECEIVGWKVDGSLGTQSIDYRVFFGDTSNRDDDCYFQVASLLAERWKVEDSKATVPLLAMCIDSAYQTQTVYSFVRALKNKRVFPIRGQEHLDTAVSSPKMADTYVNKQRARSAVRYWGVGTTILKTEMYGWLNLPQPKNDEPFPYGYCRFPLYDIDYFKMLCAEQLIVKKNKQGRYKHVWELKTNQKRNEALDIRIYNRSAYVLAGLERLTTPEQWEDFKGRLLMGEL